MALSGTIFTNVNDHWRLSISWTGVQSISGNFTDITARMFWEGLDSFGTTYTNSTDDGGIFIGGEWHHFSGVGLARLSGRQKKHIATFTKRINHASDGTASVTIDGFFDVELTLSGRFFGRVDLPGRTFTLNTIPRASDISSNANWTAGNDLTVSINRRSSSFTHTVNAFVNGKLIATKTGVGTSTTFDFTTAQNTEIFTELNGNATEDTRIEVLTFHGTTRVGTTSITGTVTAPNASTIINWSTDKFTDQTISGTIGRAHSGFRHTLKYYIGGDNPATATLVRTTTGVETSFNFTPTADEQTLMNTNMKAVNERDGNIIITTFYNGVRVRSDVNVDINFRVRNANPTFIASSISYADVNATTTGLTGDNQYIIQNKSRLMAYVNVRATGNKNADIVRYIVNANGKEKTINSSTTGSVEIGEITASNNQTLTITAVDTRGNTTSVTRTVKVIPYEAPNLVVEATRNNQFETATVLSVGGTFSTLNVKGVNKNVVTTLQYRFKQLPSGQYTNWHPLTFTTDRGTINTNGALLDLLNTREWNVEVQTVDNLGTTSTVINVGSGRPILFVDAEKRSISFNDFPQGNDEFLINGRLVFGSTQWVSSGQGEGSAGGALYLNNSDITGVNGIFFNDLAHSNWEGLLWARSGTPEGSSNHADYDNFRIMDRQWVFNNRVIMGEIHTAGGNDVNLLNGLLMFSGGVSGDHIWYDDASNEYHFVSDSTPRATGNSTLVAGSLHLMSTGDADPTNRNAPLIISRGSGVQMMLDGNEIIANTLVSIRGAHNSEFFVGADTRARVWSSSIFDRTYSGEADVCITASGTLGRRTSATKYKLNIEPVETDIISERILELQPKKWHDKQSVEDYANYLTRVANGEDVEPVDIPFIETHYGLIAEDVAEAGLPMYVQHGKPNENGGREIEGIAYDRLWTLLIPVVKKQKEQLGTQQNIINTQQAKINDLEARLLAIEAKLSKGATV